VTASVVGAARAIVGSGRDGQGDGGATSSMDASTTTHSLIAAYRSITTANERLF